MASARMVWMDGLRGIAIVLVLLWHATAIPVLRGVAMPEWIAAANDFFTPFRMPTLMFLSGLLLVRSLQKPLLEYYVGKLKFIAWPYALFALLHMLTFEQTAPIWHPYAWIATGYLWFLFYILVYYLIAPLLRWVPPIILPIVFFVAAYFVHEDRLHRMLYFAGFFFAGYVAARYRDRFDRIVGNGWVALAGGIGAIALGVWSSMNDIQYHSEYAILSLGGILSAIYLMSKAGNARWTQPLQFVGRSSLVYYVTHFPLMNLAMVTLFALGIRESLVLAPVLFVFALGIGTLLARYKKKPYVSWLFEAPIPTRVGRREPTR
jgi:peptidoglycan/LPS O-acetylase OafA/YrhL